MDINIFGEIIGDFKHLITIKMSSARCNPSITEKYYETLLKMEKEKLPTSQLAKHSLWHIIREDESIKKKREKKVHLHQNEDGEEEVCDHNHSDEETPAVSEGRDDVVTDQRILSQNASRIATVAYGLCHHISETKVLRTLEFVDLKFTHQSWNKLGKALGNNKTLTRLTLTACNLAQGKSMQELMNGFSNNSSIKRLQINDSELRDDHGIFLLQMIRAQAEKREQGQWTEGLRQ